MSVTAKTVIFSSRPPTRRGSWMDRMSIGALAASSLRRAPSIWVSAVVDWIENGETVTYDPCPPGLEDGN